jgi:hypothetical protein
MAATYYLPTENAIQLVQITIPTPASPSPGGSIFGLSPLIFYSIIEAVAAAGAIAVVSALFLIRRSDFQSHLIVGMIVRNR